MKKFALLSVSDKTNIVEFAQKIKSHNYEIIATGNTAKLLAENNIPVIQIEDYTSFPEIFSGRVKTLHPKVFGGILMRRDNQEDIKEAEKNDVSRIDIVCVNLYPFPKVVNRTDISLQEKIENIDIGGPSLIRASAKNYKYVSVLTSPEQYDNFVKELDAGEVSLETRKQLAAEAFANTSFYDTLIADYFEKEFQLPQKHLRNNLELASELRYGENPHQKGYLFGDFYNYFEVLHGKELSFNNIVDLTAAVETVNDLGEHSCVIVKHTNPCGAATSDNTYNAYVNALSCDPVSSFGGIVAFAEEVDVKTAEKLNEIFLEIICAPGYNDEAMEVLKKKKNRRLVKIIAKDKGLSLTVKNVPGGFVAQDKDNSKLSDDILKLVTDRKYSDEELENLKFAWTICKHTKSNAIVYVKDMKTIGVGAGQMSRVDSAKIASMKAANFGHELKGAVAASDAFFPFADSVEEMASQGITAIIEPGGSVRDEEVIEAANKNKISMIFTGIRNFKH